MLSNIRTSILKCVLNRYTKFSTKSSYLSLHNDLHSTILTHDNVPETTAKNNLSTENGFKIKDDKFRSQNYGSRSKTWNDSVGLAKDLTDYDMNLIQKMRNDKALGNIVDYKSLENNSSFQELVR